MHCPLMGALVIAANVQKVSAKPLFEIGGYVKWGFRR